MHPSVHAHHRPNHPAIVDARSGASRSYADLEAASNQGAQLFRALGLKAEDGVALWLENSAAFLEICWAAQRAGLHFTPISTHLTAAEAAYIVNDSGATVLLASQAVGPEVERLLADAPTLLPGVRHFFGVGVALGGAEDWAAAVATMPAARIVDETAGQPMFYSSGTTGRPKGVRLPLTGGPAVADHPMAAMNRQLFGATPEMVCVVPAPLYHAAPLTYSMVVQRIGGTVVIMESFEPQAFLDAVQYFRASHTQMVPTMFVRLLKLPPLVRQGFDLSSLRYLIHSAAPCPLEIKRQMIDWFGPVLYEYYGGTEAIGATFISSPEWQQHPGSVGRASWGSLHICDEAGNELPVGQTGTIYFAGAADFRYHGDAQRSSRARHPRHADWATLGDIGHLDVDGYLYLTDRQAFMIISGGVNIYPQEAENVLVTHPAVADVAVIGVPNEEFGEEVKAVVQPLHWSDATPALAAELLAYCRDRLAGFKCPRSVDFEPQLPRQANGKLYKQQLRERYWLNAEKSNEY